MLATAATSHSGRPRSSFTSSKSPRIGPLSEFQLKKIANDDSHHASEKLSEDSTTDNCLTSQDYEESLCSASPPICVVREGVSSELGILAEENIRIEKEIDAVRDTVERADEKYKNALFLRSRAEFSRKKAEKTLHEREREVRDWATRVETAAAEQMGLVRACQKEGVASVLLQTVSRLDQEIVQMKSAKNANKARLASKPVAAEEEMDPEMRETMEQNTAKRAELAQARDALRSLEKKAKKRCQDCGSCQKRELEEVIREKTAYKAMFETENTTAKRCQLATYAMAAVFFFLVICMLIGKSGN